MLLPIKSFRDYKLCSSAGAPFAFGAIVMLVTFFLACFVKRRDANQQMEENQSAESGGSAFYWPHSHERLRGRASKLYLSVVAYEASSVKYASIIRV